MDELEERSNKVELVVVDVQVDLPDHLILVELPVLGVRLLVHLVHDLLEPGLLANLPQLLEEELLRVVLLIGQDEGVDLHGRLMEVRDHRYRARSLGRVGEALVLDAVDLNVVERLAERDDGHFLWRGTLQPLPDLEVPEVHVGEVQRRVGMDPL